MTSDERRAALHEILDLVLEINGFEERLQKKTGSKPTLFMYFYGHVATLSIDIHKQGWNAENVRDSVLNMSLNRGDQDIINAIIELRKFKEETKNGENSNNSIRGISGKIEGDNREDLDRGSKEH